MIVVADASPLVALAICECLHVLEKLFREIKVAQAVYDEVTVPGKPKGNRLLFPPQEYNPENQYGKIKCRSRLGGVLNYYHRDVT